MVHAMKERDRIRQEKLNRLFEMAGPESIPALTPEPGLPTRIRALAGRGERTRGARRWMWVPVAAMGVMVSLGAGGYLGYRAWESTQPLNSATDEAGALMAAWSQSGFSEGLDQVETNREVLE
jgi:hypothetical protein